MVLTFEKANELLDRAVAEKGADYVYNGGRGELGECVYRGADGGPSCIVGHVVHYFDPELFKQLPEGVRSTSALSRVGIECDNRTVDLLYTAQTEQDEGHPWGEAVAAARRYAA